MAVLLQCLTCGGAVSSNAEKCPHCGEPHFVGTRECDFCEGKGYKNERTIIFSHLYDTAYDIQHSKTTICGDVHDVWDYKRTCPSCNGTGSVRDIHPQK